MKRVIFALAALLVLTGTAGAAIDRNYLAKLPPVIDRDVLFGDPQIASGQLSPDGSHISFLKPYKNVLNIWVKGISEPFAEARPVTADTTRPVRGYFWTKDGTYILYIQDKGGDENWHIYAVDPRAKLEAGQDVPPPRDLTPYKNVAATIYALPKGMPGSIFVGLNDRDERYHDAYRLDIATGERTLVKRNDTEISSWIFDIQGNLRLASKQTADGGTEILRVDPDTMVVVYTCSKDETVDPIRYHKDGKRVYMASDKGKDVNFQRLILFDPATLKEELVEADPENQVDFGGAEFSEATDELVATYYVGDRLRVYFRDKDWEKDYRRLQKQLPDGDIYLSSSTSDERLWLVGVTSDVDPGAAYLYTRATEKAELLYRPHPDLPSKDLASMKPFVYKSRDGLDIHGYLTVPKGVKDTNLPVLCMVHGGPWARDEWGYDPYAQFFANRGYAVFQMNFRGSTGYGKAFLNAGNKQWGDAMQNDITDGVHYLVTKGIADPKQIAIFGGSYGGYATLAGLAFTPDVYAAGISYVGPSNIITLLNSIPPYWAVLKTVFNERVGDPSKPEDAERLKRQSPLFSAGKIKAPLLVVQGANDPRVKKAESDQIVVALRDLGRDVEYIVAPDEGHGFAGVDNRTAFAVAAEKFLAKHLGGRYQETMSDRVRDRLGILTVDVKTVTLAAPPKGAADSGNAGNAGNADTAPLPAVNASFLRPMTLTYKGSARAGGEEAALEIVRSLAKGALGDAATWRVVTSQTSGGESAVDTFNLDATTLLPRRWSVRQGTATVVIDFTGTKVKGAIKMGAQEMPIDLALPAPAFGDGSALETIVGTLPLAPGYETTLRVFDFQLQKTRSMSLKVDGTESVTVPAGTYECFNVEIRPIDGESGASRIYVSAKDPHCMIRGTFELPPQMGGGTIAIDLASIK
jgi:dipeptidyl aminopeptidase/acylaminoacyl peptidase